MYVRVHEDSRQGQSSYIFSPHFGSYLAELGQSQTLPERLRNAWNARHNKQEIFKILRQQKSFPLDASVKTELQTIFAAGPDELWLAQRLAQHGPEPLWPWTEIKDRVAHAPKFGPDPGNYKAILQDPNPGGTLTGSLAKCKDQLSTSELPDAFFFPGRSDRRALIISGVHGDEKRGVDVVRSLQKLLETSSAAGNKPFFSTIIVPVVIPRTQSGAGKRNVPGGLGIDIAGALKCRPVEPNRNFPSPGEDLAAARARGRSGPGVPELMIRPSSGSLRRPQDTTSDPAFTVTSIRMLPETRILISLIERFQPERLASVHDHSLKQVCHSCVAGAVTKCGGEGPGIFVDPRGIDPTSGRIITTHAAQFRADDELGKKMAEGALTRLCSISPLNAAFPPFAGNQAIYPLTVRYFSKQRVEGNSLGDWAPVSAGLRPGIATLTIEIPKYDRAQAREERLVKDLHRDLLQQIFLEA
jgi:hypothetical protein